MKRALAGLLAGLIALLGPGCATMRASSMRAARPAALLPATPIPPPGNEAAWTRYLTAIPVGSRVRAMTTGGAVVEGMFLGVEEGRVVLQPAGGGERLRVATSSLAQIGWGNQRSRLPWIIVAIVTIVLVAILASQPGSRT